jgi:uncharacterized lipoprotein YddW (UPF0748 family)
MSLRCLLLVLILVTIRPSSAAAQVADPPLYEARGAWLTTVWRLDWPPQSSASVQEQQLRNIIRNMKSLGMNTVVFQVLSHGEAMYESERLPWANWLTGSPGLNPGFDPLAVAVDEAHTNGMELHAWMNVFHVAAPTSNISPTVEPLHVRYAHPEWVQQISDGTWWGNPGIPAFRDWQIANAMEIVSNYDVDAIHFDYMRYPERAGLPGDADLMLQEPNGASSLAEWRRENVNRFVRAAYDSVKSMKPWVKVGSAPIGAYRWFQNAPPGYWAWDDLYQDGFRWLADGVMDYVAPQLYFTIGTAPLPPNTYLSQDFDHWMQGWMANRNGRHVYSGHAAWLETAESRFPAGEVARQIESARAAGAHGQFHFRYAHTTGSPFGGHYQRPSLMPEMTWQDGTEPSTPATGISYDRDSRVIEVSWSEVQSDENDPVRRYAIFRRVGGTPDETSALDLIGFVGATTNTWSEAFPSDPEAFVRYSVVAQTATGRISRPSNAVSTETTSLRSEDAVDHTGDVTLSIYPNPASNKVSVEILLPAAVRGQLTVFDMLGRRVHHVDLGVLAAGRTLSDMDIPHLPPGHYLIELSTESGRYSKRFSVVR